MEDTTTAVVIGEAGLRGRLLTEPSSDGAPVVVMLENGHELRVPSDVLVRQPDGSYYMSLGDRELGKLQTPSREHAPRHEEALVVPVYQEELSVGKRTVETGRARITKHVEEREVVVDEPLLREDVQIEHVPINRVWEGAPPAPRYEADKLIVPLLEEVLVVEKRLMLKEELHISRVQKTVHEPQTVVLRNESVTVERVDPAAERPTSNPTR